MKCYIIITLSFQMTAAEFAEKDAVPLPGDMAAMFKYKQTKEEMNVELFTTQLNPFSYNFRNFVAANVEAFKALE